jgi:hypothetical protein
MLCLSRETHRQTFSNGAPEVAAMCRGSTGGQGTAAHVGGQKGQFAVVEKSGAARTTAERWTWEQTETQKPLSSVDCSMIDQERDRLARICIGLHSLS